MVELRVGTFNILNGSCRYQERMPLVQKTLAEMECDLVGVQEIHKGLNLPYLPQENGVFFDVEHPLELRGEPTFHIDGNAVFLKSPLTAKSSQIYHFETRVRCAGVVTVDLAGQPLHFCVAHLDYDGEELAVRQVHELLRFLTPYMSDSIVLVGDFNFTPESQAYAAIRTHFRSVFVDRYGEEPVITFPTGLLGPYLDNGKSGTYDYIYVKGRIEVVTAELHGQHGGNGVWPSDHYALAARIRVVSK